MCKAIPALRLLYRNSCSLQGSIARKRNSGTHGRSEIENNPSVCRIVAVFTGCLVFSWRKLVCRFRNFTSEACHSEEAEWWSYHGRPEWEYMPRLEFPGHYVRCELRVVASPGTLLFPRFYLELADHVHRRWWNCPNKYISFINFVTFSLK